MGGTIIVPGFSRHLFWITYFACLGGTLIYSAFLIQKSAQQYKNPSVQIGVQKEQYITMPTLEICAPDDNYMLDCDTPYACNCLPFPEPPNGISAPKKNPSTYYDYAVPQGNNNNNNNGDDHDYATAGYGGGGGDYTGGDQAGSSGRREKDEEELEDEDNFGTFSRLKEYLAKKMSHRSGAARRTKTEAEHAEAHAAAARRILSTSTQSQAQTATQAGTMTQSAAGATATAAGASPSPSMASFSLIPGQGAWCPSASDPDGFIQLQGDQVYVGNYDSSGINNQDCIFRLQANVSMCPNRQGFVHFTLMYYDTEMTYDYLSVIDGSIGGPVISTFTGPARNANPPHPKVSLYSTGSTMTLQYQSDDSYALSGFYGVANTSCTAAPPYCAPGCPPWFLNDTVCDPSCFTAGCGFDGNDCKALSAQVAAAKAGDCTKQYGNPTPRKIKSKTGSCVAFNFPNNPNVTKFDSKGQIVKQGNTVSANHLRILISSKNDSIGDEAAFMEVVIGGKATTPPVDYAFQGYTYRVYHPVQTMRTGQKSKTNKGLEYAMPVDSLNILSISAQTYKQLNGRLTWSYVSSATSVPLTTPAPGVHDDKSPPCSVPSDSRNLTCTTTLVKMQVSSFTIQTTNEFVALTPLAVIGALGGFWSICAGFIAFLFPAIGYDFVRSRWDHTPPPPEDIYPDQVPLLQQIKNILTFKFLRTDPKEKEWMAQHGSEMSVRSSEENSVAASS